MLDEQRTPDEAEIHRARTRLQQMLRDEFAPTRRITSLIEHHAHTGDRASPTLPIMLIKAAVNKACRVAESLNEKKATLTIGKVKARMQAEMRRLI